MTNNTVEIEPIMLRMQRNDPELLLLRLYTALADSRTPHYHGGHTFYHGGKRCRRQDHPSAWSELGRNVGKNAHLKKIVFCGLLRVNNANVHHNNNVVMMSAREQELLESFCRGLNSNRSIEELTFLNCHFINEFPILEIMEGFFEKNRHLVSLGIRRCNLATEGICSLSSCLIQARFIKKIDLSDNRIDGESVHELIKALFLSHDLEELSLAGNAVGGVGGVGGQGQSGCLALAALLQKKDTKLKKLNLRRNQIDDGGAIILAKSLKNNTTLTHLGLGGNPAIGHTGWDALSKLVHDPSSFTSTYSCNHTLSVLTGGSMPFQLPYAELELNKLPNKVQVKRQKIFRHHFLQLQRDNFRTEPFASMEVGLLIHVVKFIDLARAEMNMMMMRGRTMTTTMIEGQDDGDDFDERRRNADYARFSILFFMMKNIPQVFGVNGNRTHPRLR